MTELNLKKLETQLRERSTQRRFLQTEPQKLIDLPIRVSSLVEMICMQQMTKLTTKSWWTSALTNWTMTRCFRVRQSSSPCCNSNRVMSRRRLTGASGSKSSARTANRHSLVVLRLCNSASFSSMDSLHMYSKKETHKLMKSERSSCRPTRWKAKCSISKISNRLRFWLIVLMPRLLSLIPRKSCWRRSESHTLKASCSSRRVKTRKKARFIYSSICKTLVKNQTRSTKTFWA